MVEILITNDDGIEAQGLAVMAEVLSTVGDVTVVAPLSNQSGVGRMLSYGGSIAEPNTYSRYKLDYEEHSLGHGFDGTPCDCVIIGLRGLDLDPDIVVSGCNPGANCGRIASFRSGTVAAALEAAELGTPGMAVSVERPTHEPTAEEFRRAAEVSRDLMTYAFETGLFEAVDYLNVNVPQAPRSEMDVEITTPLPFYEWDVGVVAGRATLENIRYQRVTDRTIKGGDGTDLLALQRGNLSLTPFELPTVPVESERLRGFDLDGDR
jgi:5'-nucleotidase